MTETKVGLLPLYLELYDNAVPAAREKVESFLVQVVRELVLRGLRVKTTPVCRIRKEFDAAVAGFERDGVDAIITLHLAYSPSLESAGALARTRLPVIVLDTTPAFEFGPDQSPDQIMPNHGIHGVQDMCNLLLRNGKPFIIEAGHWRKSDVIDRVVGHVRAAKVVSALRRARVGLVGGAFRGMGDFSVEPAVIRRALGPVVVAAGLEKFRAYARRVSKAEIEDELAADRKRFKIAPGAGAAHRRATAAGLALRRWVEDEALTAFSFNFCVFRKRGGLPVVPFLEASKAMERGIGFAGEGDALTASLVGALFAGFPETSFAEMFCPDWKGNRVFMSHMGEMNTGLAAGRVSVYERAYPFIAAESTAAAVGCFKAGPAAIVNLAPLADNRFRLVIVRGAMVPGGRKDRFPESVRGWFRPKAPLADMLAAYSRAGGTHHSALVYTTDFESLRNIGMLAGMETVVI